MLFGEIDCREGLLLAVEKCKYDTIEEGISVTVDIYMCVLKRLLLKGFELFIHPVPPVLNETRHIVLPFNAMLKDRVCSLAAGNFAVLVVLCHYMFTANLPQVNMMLLLRTDHSGSLHWLDFLDSLLTDDKKHLEPSLEFDGTHLSPSYVKHLRMELERIS